MSRSEHTRLNISCRRGELEWVISIDALGLAMQVEGPDLKSALEQWIEYLEDFHAVLEEDEDHLGPIPEKQLVFLRSVGIRVGELDQGEESQTK